MGSFQTFYPCGLVEGKEAAVAADGIVSISVIKKLDQPLTLVVGGEDG